MRQKITANHQSKIAERSCLCQDISREFFRLTSHASRLQWRVNALIEKVPALRADSRTVTRFFVSVLLSSSSIRQQRAVGGDAKR